MPSHPKREIFIKIMAYTVYMHRNKTNGKVYIGQTGVSVEERWKNGKGYHHNAHFQSAIKKYGWDGFEHIIMFDGITKEQACDLEQKLISKYDSTNSERGYNNSIGGEKGCLGRKITDETREKLRKSHLGKPSPRKGAIISPESREKMRRAKLGKPQSEETKKKRAMAQWKPVICIETGEIFESAKAANIHFGLKKDRISSAIRKGRKVNGFTWQFLQEYNANEHGSTTDT